MGTGAELCRYSLRDAGSETGLLVSKIAREAGGRWSFHALGVPFHGSMYKDSLPHIRRICHDDTRKLMARCGTGDSHGASDEGEPLVGTRVVAVSPSGKC